MVCPVRLPLLQKQVDFSVCLLIVGTEWQLPSSLHVELETGSTHIKLILKARIYNLIGCIS